MAETIKSADLGYLQYPIPNTQYLMNLLFSALNIRTGERRLVGLVLLYAFFMGISGIATETIAFALFLAEFDAQAIPYLYIGFAIVTTLISLLYAKLEERLSFSKLMTLNLLLVLLSLCLLRLFLSLEGAKWPVILLAIWQGTIWILNDLALWSLAVRLFNVRQSKRLFGLIRAGFLLGEVVSAFSLSHLVTLLGLPNLLLFAAGGVGATLIMQTFIMRTFGEQLFDTEEEEEEKDNGQSFFELIQNRYIALILGFAALGKIAYYLLDNLFYAQTQSVYPVAEELAAFMGLFFTVVGIFELLIGAFISGRLINRYGLRVALLILPVTLTIGIGSVALVGTLWASYGLIFWLVVINKFFAAMLNQSIDGPALRILYQPLPVGQRLRAQMVIEGIVEPIGIGVAGVLLLLFNLLGLFNATQIAYLLLLLLAAWIAILFILTNTYPVMLRQALSKRKLSTAEIQADKSSLHLLQQGLQSPRLGVVLYSLDMLEEIAAESLTDLLKSLLEHPAQEVRLDVLRRIERLHITSALPLIKERLNDESSWVMQGASLRTMGALGDAKILQEVSVYLDSPQPEVRLGAMIGLLRRGELEHILAAGQKLLDLVNSSAPRERALAAQVLGEGQVPFVGPLLRLLEDKEVQVQRAALVAASQLKHPRVWGVVTKLLGGAPVLHSVAMTTLVAGGEAVLPYLQSAFATLAGRVKEQQAQKTLMRLAVVCGRIGEAAIPLLQEQLAAQTDNQIRYHLLLALQKTGYQAKEEERALIEKEIKAEVAAIVWLLTIQLEFDDFERQTEKSIAQANGNIPIQRSRIGMLPFAFKAALQNRLLWHQKRLFLWLSFLYEPLLIRQIQDNLAHPEAEKRAYSVDMIDSLLSADLSRILIPLFDAPRLPGESSVGERRSSLKRDFFEPRLGHLTRLSQLINDPDERLDPWTRALAFVSYAQLAPHTVALREAAEAARSAPQAIVSETARWILAQLDTKRGEPVMPSMIEKVITLKSTTFFAKAEENILTNIAATLKEVEIEAGETIIKQDELGDCMYIILEGEVEVLNRNQLLNQLTAGDVFGEIALLDPTPRSASVIALSHTYLLRLDGEPFKELISDYPEVAQSIMQVLAQRLRRAQIQPRPTEDW